MLSISYTLEWGYNNPAEGAANTIFPLFDDIMNIVTSQLLTPINNMYLTGMMAEPSGGACDPIVQLFLV